jgi:muramoyltetrapeptide carboxypeptidase
VEFRFPPALRPGDKIAIVAPASPFRASEFWRGYAWLRDRYEVMTSARIFDRHGYLAGTDARRMAELRNAMLEPGVRAIVCARGGYGAMRLVPELPWDEFTEQPRWLVGFSDITALHAVLSTRRVASIHGPHVTGLGRDVTPHTRAAWLQALERPRAARTWANLRVLHGGRASGVVVGGNLSLVEAMACTGELYIPLGSILMLEDVSERPYRIDRMLTSLALGGHLSRVTGIVFGSFTACDPGSDGVRVLDVLAERTKRLGIPVLADAPFGHGEDNDAFVLGSRGTLDGATFKLTGV